MAARRTAPLALAAAALAAASVVAAILLWRTTVPARLHLGGLDMRAFFSAGDLARARTFERFQAVDVVLGQLVTLAALFAYASRGAVFVRESAAGRIGTGMLLAMLGFAVVWLGRLPFDVAELWWERRYHVAHAGYPGFIASDFLALGGRFLFVCLAVLIAMALAAPLRRTWWAAAVPVLAALALAQAFVGPYLLTGTRPLSDSRLAAAADRFARRDGLGHVAVVVQETHRVTTAPNAEAVGLRPNQRVVLWDTLLLPRFTESELDAVVAHELGHLQRQHILKLVGWEALLSLPLALAIALATRRRGGMYEPVAVPVAIFVFALAQFALLPLRNVVHRRYEAEADWISLQSTRDPAAERGLMVQLALASLADPSPPAWDYVLLQDHPTLGQRIALADAWARSR